MYSLFVGISAVTLLSSLDSESVPSSIKSELSEYELSVNHCRFKWIHLYYCETPKNSLQLLFFNLQLIQFYCPATKQLILDE
ncbi:hypothetical protein BpHYR1_052102 [Brachionus plicatilis]|uniref:Uncharacterized protein n=1 Tax=Brachionus plicatilis TaxID=10195 RepID=A0A3M7RQ63_BRAPC|nr:hypothetical protein BpHYR1_052102 [Brachionus plicatilis]